jgi:hypothetical protein
MKFIPFLSPILKSIVGVVAFLISLGWAAFLSVNAIVKAEGQEIREEVKQIRDIDMAYLANRFDRIEAKLDRNLSRKGN